MSGAGPVDLTVVVMTYDEVRSVGRVLQEIVGVLRTLPVAGEVLVVDDGSTDGSGDVVRALAAELPEVRLVVHPENRGLGGVYRTGFEQARGDLLTFFPADGQFPATIVRDFLSRIGDCDFVLGYLPEGRPTPVGRFLSAAERLVYRLLFGPVPRFQGIMLFRRRVLRDLPLASRDRSWVVVMELIIRAKRAGFRMTSAPTTVRPREFGTSKVNNWRTIRTHLRQIVRLFFALRNAPGHAATRDPQPEQDRRA